MLIPFSIKIYFIPATDFNTFSSRSLFRKQKQMASLPSNLLCRGLPSVFIYTPCRHILHIACGTFRPLSILFFSFSFSQSACRLHPLPAIPASIGYCLYRRSVFIPHLPSFYNLIHHLRAALYFSFCATAIRNTDRFSSRLHKRIYCWVPLHCHNNSRIPVLKYVVRIIFPVHFFSFFRRTSGFSQLKISVAALLATLHDQPCRDLLF